MLCTHMHVDHVGWNTRLVDDQWVPTFPNARYLFGREEWTHWSNEVDSELDGDVEPHIAQNVLEARLVHQDSVRPIIDADLHQVVDSTHKLTDEISLQPTPGHTPGHVSIRIESRDQHAIITGDLMHHPIQCAMPEVNSNFDFDLEQAITTRKGFLTRYADRPVLVLGTHFRGPPLVGSNRTAVAGGSRLSLRTTSRPETGQMNVCASGLVGSHTGCAGV